MRNLLTPPMMEFLRQRHQEGQTNFELLAQHLREKVKGGSFGNSDLTQKIKKDSNKTLAERIRWQFENGHSPETGPDGHQTSQTSTAVPPASKKPRTASTSSAPRQGTAKRLQDEHSPESGSGDHQGSKTSTPIPSASKKAKVASSSSPASQGTAKRPGLEEKQRVAIDFGTKYTKVAFTYGRNPDGKFKVAIRSASFPDLRDTHEKATPTCLLAEENDDGSLKLIAFGKKAMAKWRESKGSKMKFFVNYKLALSPDRLRDGETAKVAATDGTKHDLLQVLTLTFSAIIQSTLYSMKLLQGKPSDNQYDPDSMSKFGLSISTVVITMPALWGNDAQILMRSAFCKAVSIPEGASRDMLKLVHEPEAAVVHWALKELLHKDVLISVLDMGGGTVDISSLRVISSLSGRNKIPLFATEVTPSGGLCGSKKVDEAFLETFVKVIFAKIYGASGGEEYTKFEKTTYCIDLLEQFEMMKKDFDPADSGDASQLLCTHLTSYLTSVDHLHWTVERIAQLFNQDASHQVGVTGCNLEFHHKLIESFFNETIKRIIEVASPHVKAQANRTHHLILAGGFSASTLLRSRLQDAFPRKTLKVMEDPQMAIVSGALDIAMNDDLIRTRKLNRTYGIEVFEEFDAGNKVHTEIVKEFEAAKKKTTIYKKEGDEIIEREAEVVSIFKPLPGLRKGNEVSRNLDYIIDVYSIEVGSKTVDFDLYVTENDDCACVFDPRMKKFGTISHELSGEKMEGFQIVFRAGETEPTVKIFRDNGPQTRLQAGSLQAASSPAEPLPPGPRGGAKGKPAQFISRLGQGSDKSDRTESGKAENTLPVEQLGWANL